MKLLALIVCVIGLTMVGVSAFAKRNQLILGDAAQVAPGLDSLAPQGQRPAWSRGIQLLTISFDECAGRARRALEAEGFTVESGGSSFSGDQFFAGSKDGYCAAIACNASPTTSGTWANVFVGSFSGGDVAGSQRQRLQTQMGQPSVSTKTCTFQYRYWDGSNWTGQIDRGEFVHAPNGNFGAAHRDTIIRYISWDGGRWTAKISGNHFVHAPNDDWNSAHDDVILKYIDWNGGQGSIRIGDCR